jgi:hypothetical protein
MRVNDQLHTFAILLREGIQWKRVGRPGHRARLHVVDGKEGNPILCGQLIPVVSPRSGATVTVLPLWFTWTCAQAHTTRTPILTRASVRVCVYVCVCVCATLAVALYGFETSSPTLQHKMWVLARKNIWIEQLEIRGWMGKNKKRLRVTEYF